MVSLQRFIRTVRTVFASALAAKPAAKGLRPQRPPARPPESGRLRSVWQPAQAGFAVAQQPLGAASAASQSFAAIVWQLVARRADAVVGSRTFYSIRPY